MARVKVGVTGVPGAGKSALLEVFRAKGYPTVNADEVGHRVLDSVSSEVARVFGPQFLKPSGEVDRKRLGELVFKDPEALRKLENLVAPKIAFELGKLMEEAPGEVVFVEAAMLFEYRLERIFDLTVAVVGDLEEVKRRAARKLGYPVEVIEGMLRRQLPQEEKARRADIVVRNTGSLAELERQAERVLEEIRRRFGLTG